MLRFRQQGPRFLRYAFLESNSCRASLHHPPPTSEHMIPTGPVKGTALLEGWISALVPRAFSQGRDQLASPATASAALTAEDRRELQLETGERFSSVQHPGGVDHGG